MASTSSTIAILSGASLAVSAAAVGGVSKTDTQDVNNNNNNGALPHHHKPQINLQSTTLGKECNTLELDSSNNNDKWVAKSEDNKEDDTDIGLLIVNCNNDNENCLPDDTSSLGGRCITRNDITNSPPGYKASTNITAKRQLRQDPDVEWIKDALEGKVSIVSLYVVYMMSVMIWYIHYYTIVLTHILYKFNLYIILTG